MCALLMCAGNVAGHDFFQVSEETLAATLLLILSAAIVYSLLSIVAAQRYLAIQSPEPLTSEPISILKPLAGLDLDLESNLRTFFEQDYPAFEILFAVRDAGDPAVEVVTRLQRQYPNVSSRLLFTGEPPYPNPKVYSLNQMLHAALHDLVVMSDSDIRVTPHLLRTTAAEFQDPKLGVATALTARSLATASGHASKPRA